jgi:hypothetical protein
MAAASQKRKLVDAEVKPKLAEAHRLLNALLDKGAALQKKSQQGRQIWRARFYFTTDAKRTSE